MTRKLYVTILTIVTIICIIIGSVVNIGNLFDRLYRGIQGLTEAGSDTDSSSGTYTLNYVEGTDYTDFTSLDIDVDVMDITIQPGEAYSVQYTGNQKKMDPVISMSGDTLVVTQTIKKQRWGSTNNVKCRLVITVPEDVSLENLTIQADVGDIDINDLTVTDFDVSADVGDVDMDHVSMDQGKLGLDVGDLDMDNCSFTDFSVSCDVGDVKITADSDLSKYAVELSCDMGSVTVNDQDQKRSFTQRGEDGSLTVTNSVGDIRVKMTEDRKE